MSAIVSNLKEYIVSCLENHNYDAVPKDNFTKVIADHLKYTYYNHDTCRNERPYDRERVLYAWFAMRELLLKKFEIPTIRDVVKSMQEYPYAFMMIMKELLNYDIYDDNVFVHNYVDDCEEQKNRVEHIVYIAKYLREKYCSMYEYPDVSELPVEMSANLYDDAIVTLKYRSADEVMTILIEYLQEYLRNNNDSFKDYRRSKKYYNDLLNIIDHDVLDYCTRNIIQDSWYTIKAFVTYNCCDFTNDKEFIEEFNKKNPRLAEKYHILYDRVTDLAVDCVLFGGSFKFSEITIDLPELIE